MSASAESTEADEQSIYKFRFDTSDKLVQLTPQQLDRIPYLLTVVTHKGDFLSTQNDQDEYILHRPIHYNWFMAIFNSITTEQPYALFTSLPEEDNILDALQLADYLGLNAFLSPILDEPNIVLSNPNDDKNENKRIVFHRAKNLSEARNTAAEFVISLTKNEYDLDYFKTIECVLSLISVIFSKRDVFSSRFRHHTLTILEEYVFPLLFKERLIHLLAAMQQSNTIDSEIYLTDDTQPLPTNFENAFAWKGKYMLVKVNYSDDLINLRRLRLVLVGQVGSGKSSLINALLGRTENRLSATSDSSSVVKLNSNILFTIIDTAGLYESTAQARTASLLMNPVAKELCINEAQSARSGRLNKLPKRPKVDRFKHKCGPKTQKYR